MWLVWKAPATRQRDQPRLGRRSVGEGRQLLHGAGGHDLAGAVVVGGGEAVQRERGQHLLAVAAEDGGHAGRGLGDGVGHRLAALADQHHGLLGGDDARTGRGGRSRRRCGRPPHRSRCERVAGVREEVERRDQAGRDQQRLGDLGARMVSASALVP